MARAPGRVLRYLVRERGENMKGQKEVLELLNEVLAGELVAINQYFLHAEMCENWGYHKLSDFIKKQSIGEMKHAEVLIERILFLDGSPSMMPLELKVGGTVKASDGFLIDVNAAQIKGTRLMKVKSARPMNSSVWLRTRFIRCDVIRFSRSRAAGCC